MPQEQLDIESNNVLVALGSNATSDTEDARAIVLAAVNVLRAKFVGLAVSRLFQTPAFPVDSGPDFVNAACRFTSDQKPEAILEILHGIEADFGRERSVRWGQRTLDLDLISYRDAVRPDLETHARWVALPIEAQKKDTPDVLILPHPRLQDRPFVLVPLADIAPDWCHPVTGETVVQMRDAHPTSALGDIRPLK